MMAWRRPGDKSLSEPMVARLPMQLYVFSLNELNHRTHKSWSWTDPHCDTRLRSCLGAGDLLSTHGVAMTVASWAVRGAALFSRHGFDWDDSFTVRCRYNAVKFLRNPHNRHSICPPIRVRCGVSLVSTNSDYTPSQPLYPCFQYHAILVRVVAALYCISFALNRIIHVPRWTKGGDQSLWTFTFLLTFHLCSMPNLICEYYAASLVYRAKLFVIRIVIIFHIYMRHSPISRVTFNRNGLFSMFYMFTCFSYFVHWLQTLCIYVWLEAFFWIGIDTLHFSWFCTMIDVEQEEGEFIDNMAGTENDLNHVLSPFVDSEHEIPNFCNSRYVDMSELQSLFINNGNEFLILTLNIQSVNAKFNNLFPVINNLASQGLYFGAICLQETWTSNDSDLSLLQLPGYQLIHQGSKCTKHGGLIIYLNESYSYKMRNLYTRSNLGRHVHWYQRRQPLSYIYNW